jgi:hypothetical protein
MLVEFSTYTTGSVEFEEHVSTAESPAATVRDIGHVTIWTTVPSENSTPCPPTIGATLCI